MIFARQKETAHHGHRRHQVHQDYHVGCVCVGVYCCSPLEKPPGLWDLQRLAVANARRDGRPQVEAGDEVAVGTPADCGRVCGHDLQEALP